MKRHCHLLSLQDNDTLEGRLKQRVPGGMYSDFLGAEHADPAPRRKYRRQDSSRHACQGFPDLPEAASASS